MSSAADRTRLRLSVLELIAVLDAQNGGTGIVRAAFPVEPLESGSLPSDAADLLLLARLDEEPAAFLTVLEVLVGVLASAESSLQLRTLGTLDRSVIYGVGPDWTVDIVIRDEGECLLGLLRTADVPATLRSEHLVLDASLDLTLLIRGAAGPVDLVFVDGVLANGRGEGVALRGSGVAPNEFGDLLESALAGYLTTASLAGSEA
ncbi:hypothetical protein [Rathayibacter sp. VKM Ac-2857]|uniref:hypothetical protein n=1 Tax=Rathayibacter sp. VKM Ac-2857 TaxID=2739020 RepID=UPI0015657D62|nr:hypothetical protein [Rathayibacter sp. VKM Ac-2857]NQX16048.1 hypothetical protein [Rathayibacter sp. VKM Ac-2857]